MDEAAARVEFLTQFLATRDVACPGCTYNLRGLTSGACPECGSEVQLTVGLTEPRMGAFIAGVAGLAAGLGFSVLLMLYFAWMVTVARYGRDGGDVLWTLSIGTLATGAALAFWIRKRRTIRRMNPALRWVLVAAGYLLSLGVAMLFFAIVR